METVIVAALSLVGTLVGAYLANRKSTALIAYRLEELEEKVNKHNNLVERTYKLEQQMEVIETELKGAENLLTEKVKVANHRIEDLEKAT
jgi:hypothetical protein